MLQPIIMSLSHILEPVSKDLFISHTIRYRKLFSGVTSCQRSASGGLLSVDELSGYELIRSVFFMETRLSRLQSTTAHNIIAGLKFNDHSRKVDAGRYLSRIHLSPA